MYRDQFTHLHQAEALSFLRTLPCASVDAVVTDPPYSSGGFTRGDRCQRTGSKYTLHGTTKRYTEWHGDNRDQRSFAYWCALWLSECARIVKPSGYLMVFSDWRQLGSMSDAIQAGGWIYRGNILWDKTGASRPQKNWFRTGQLEYVMLGTNGPMLPEQDRDGPCLEGVYRDQLPGDKLHQTGKPVGLMRWLLSILPDNSAILDPFCGSGTTLLAAKELWLQATGSEMGAEICATARDRLISPPPLFPLYPLDRPTPLPALL